MEKSLKIFAPATVSNVGPGFDLMGFALETPGDTLIVKLNNLNRLRIINNSGTGIPDDPNKNVATVALMALLKKLDTRQGFDLIFEEKINPGSGIGSSAASSTAAVYGANALLGSPFNANDLILFALEGEMLASGSLHADNIAPAMLGGFVLIRSYSPLDIISLPVPDDLKCLVVHPAIEIKTAMCRKILPENIPLGTGIKQCGNIAGLVTGIIQSDFKLLYRSLHDEFAEPHRSKLIPGYLELKSQLNNGQTGGCNISGSGPSIFYLTHDEEQIQKATGIIKKTFNDLNIKYNIYLSGVSRDGTRIV